MNVTGKNSFTNNYAENSGGAVLWEDLEPYGLNSPDCYFNNNTALIYGPNVATFAQRIIQINATTYSEMMNLT